MQPVSRFNESPIASVIAKWYFNGKRSIGFARCFAGLRAAAGAAAAACGSVKALMSVVRCQPAACLSGADRVDIIADVRLDLTQ